MTTLAEGVGCRVKRVYGERFTVSIELPTAYRVPIVLTQVTTAMGLLGSLGSVGGNLRFLPLLEKSITDLMEFIEQG
jgi:hypothetical protein